jgi:hypothetical protein
MNIKQIGINGRRKCNESTLKTEKSIINKERKWNERAWQWNEEWINRQNRMAYLSWNNLPS